jgi:multisubunit Na+/H+ antiporter MnhC subunit
MIIYLASIVLLLIGIYCAAVKKNLIKMIVGVVIMEYAINLFLVMLGYRYNGVDPVIEKAVGSQLYVSPLPQAMAVTSIIIGLATTIIMVAVALRLHVRYGTFDITKIRKLRG